MKNKLKNIDREYVFGWLLILMVITGFIANILQSWELGQQRALIGRMVKVLNDNTEVDTIQSKNDAVIYEWIKYMESKQK